MGQRSHIKRFVSPCNKMVLLYTGLMIPCSCYASEQTSDFIGPEIVATQIPDLNPVDYGIWRLFR